RHAACGARVSEIGFLVWYRPRLRTQRDLCRVKPTGIGRISTRAVGTLAVVKIHVLLCRRRFDTESYRMKQRKLSSVAIDVKSRLDSRHVILHGDCEPTHNAPFVGINVMS